MIERISRYVISTYANGKYKVVATFSSKFVARWEYFSKIGNKEYTNLVLMDTEKGKVLHKYGEVNE